MALAFFHFQHALNGVFDHCIYWYWISSFWDMKLGFTLCSWGVGALGLRDWGLGFRWLGGRWLWFSCGVAYSGGGLVSVFQEFSWTVLEPRKKVLSYRSSRWEVLSKKDALKNVACNFIQKETRTQVFSCAFWNQAVRAFFFIVSKIEVRM